MGLKDGKIFQKLQKMPKNQLLIAGLLGVLLLVIAMPADSGNGAYHFLEESKEEESGESDTGGGLPSANTAVYEKQLERRLTEVLQTMEGVGRVEVMITIKDSGESIVEKDSAKSERETMEEDGSAKRTEQEVQSQEETVFSGSGSSGQKPFVTKSVSPRIEGVLVVAEGGGKPAVVKNISDAVLALLPVEVHKIKVVQMEM